MKLSTTEKRKQVIERLQKQLSSGIKPRKNGTPFSSYDPDSVKMEDKKPIAIWLDKNDVARINKEIEVLKTRI